jgi:hypothetical protein
MRRIFAAWLGVTISSWPLGTQPPASPAPVRFAVTGDNGTGDRSFRLVELAVAAMSFQAITRTGRTIDSGVIQKESRP